MAENVPSPLDRLPHQTPFRFVSRLHLLNPGHARGSWIVQGTEDFFAGHFPGNPIVPGVLLGEALAQLSGLILLPDSSGALTARLAHLDVKLTSAVHPPAEIDLESMLTRTIGDLSLFNVCARFSGVTAALGTVTLLKISQEDPR